MFFKCNLLDLRPFEAFQWPNGNTGFVAGVGSGSHGQRMVYVVELACRQCFWVDQPEQVEWMPLPMLVTGCNTDEERRNHLIRDYLQGHDPTKV